MDTIELLQRLHSDRATIVAELTQLDRELRALNAQQQNAQSFEQQSRISARHRRVVFFRHQAQDKLTTINAQIKVANLQRQTELATFRRSEVA